MELRCKCVRQLDRTVGRVTHVHEANIAQACVWAGDKLHNNENLNVHNAQIKRLCKRLNILSFVYRAPLGNEEQPCAVVVVPLVAGPSLPLSIFLPNEAALA